MAKAPAKDEAKTEEKPAAKPAPKKGSGYYFGQSANQAGMAAALMATMILNVPMFQHAATNNIKGMVIFEVVLMFVCTASVGMLALTLTRNFSRGIIEELRAKATGGEAGED